MSPAVPEICNSILECVGNTPLVRLHKVTAGIRTPVLAKCEFMNPGSSIKDRIGLAIIEDAERSGKLKPGGIIVEGTSGNTGVGLAIAAAIRGYRCIFTIPDKMSTEKVKLLKAFGAEVIVTPTVGVHHPEYYVTVAKRIVEENESAVLANQFYNQANPLAHYQSTGPELWRQTAGKLSVLVGGMGTGGTMTGCARYLKEQNPRVRIVGADPVGSVLQAAKHTGQIPEGQPYKVEGIGGDKVPGTLDLALIDEIRTVGDKESFLMARRLAREEGLFVGGSSGLAVVTALEIAREMDDPEAMVVVILADTGERYLSKLHNDEWMTENRFLEQDTTRARDVLARKRAGTGLAATTPDRTVKQVLASMNEHGITQMPVLADHECVGSAREAALMARAIENRSILDTAVLSVMDVPYPVVFETEPMSHVARLFTRENEAVLVRRNGKIDGIITRFDVIQHLSGR